MGTINYVVEDNGKGFDPETLSALNGIGLKNIRSRVEYLEGRLIQTHRKEDRQHIVLKFQIDRILL